MEETGVPGGNHRPTVQEGQFTVLMYKWGWGVCPLYNVCITCDDGEYGSGGGRIEVVKGSDKHWRKACGLCSIMQDKSCG